MKLMAIGKAAEYTGYSIQHLRDLHKQGKLIPNHIAESGHRRYTQEQLDEFVRIKKLKEKPRKIIGYCRVSSKKQSGDLERQIENVRTFLLAQGKSFEIITDIGSGINYNKQGLQKLIKLVNQDEVETIFVLYKDRLLRYGYELLEYVSSLHGTLIQVIDQTDKTEQQELVEDLVQIITVFACKLQGKRSQKARKAVNELVQGLQDKDFAEPDATRSTF
jgi:predicted site-specific integrase-resolvase